MSRVPIPGAKRVRDALSDLDNVDGGNGKPTKTEKKRRKSPKDYGTSNRVLRPRTKENKVLKESK